MRTISFTGTDNTKEKVTFKDVGEILTIAVNELIYVIYRDKHFLLFMKNELLIIKGNYTDVLDQLPKHFVEIYKQTIVNLNYMEQIHPNERMEIVNNSGYHKLSKEYLDFLCSIFRINTPIT